MRTPTSRTDGGFTLIELMLVVVILAMTAAVVAPRIGEALPSRRLRAAADEVVGMAATARAEARLKRIEVEVVYDFDANALILQGPAATLEEDGTVVYDAEEREDLLTRKMPEGTKLLQVCYGQSGIATSGTTAAAFKASGAVGEHMVVLENERGDTLSVFVPALTGGAMVVEEGASYGEVRSSRRLM